MSQWDYVNPPAVEPINPYEAANQALLDGDGVDYDLIDRLIPAARLFAENATNRTLVARQVRLTVYDTDPACERLELPRGPVRSVDAVTDRNGATVAPTGYQLRRCGTADYLQFRQLPAWPPTVLYTAGYGPFATDVPADVRQAIALHVTHLYENRSASTTQPQQHVLAGLDAIYGPYRAGGMIGLRRRQRDSSGTSSRSGSRSRSGRRTGRTCRRSTPGSSATPALSR